MPIFIMKFFPPHQAVKVKYTATKPNYLLFKNNLLCILLVYSLLRTIDDITVGVWDVMGNFKLFSLTKLSVHSFKEENVACSPTVDLFVHQSFV